MAERPRGTVLVVDDAPTIRLIAERMLMMAGFGVVCCASGEEALGVLASHDGSLDVLVSDVRLDGMSGPTLVAEVRRRHPSIGIVLMSGDEAAEAAETGPAPGTRFLRKPFAREALVAAVEAELALRGDP